MGNISSPKIKVKLDTLIFAYALFILIRQKIGLSVEFVMGPLAAAVSALAGKAVVQSLRTFIGSSFYVGLVAPPSSG